MKNILNYKSTPECIWDGMPIGNGFMGAILTTEVPYDTVFLNNDSLWYGKKRDRENPDAYRTVKEIREELKKGNHKRANSLAYAGLTPIPKYFGPYQPLCNLSMLYCGGKMFGYENYKRSLDISKGIAKMSYSAFGHNFEREYFMSYPDKIMAIKITADAPVIEMQCNLMRRPFDDEVSMAKDGIITLGGKTCEGGISYFTAAKAYTDGKMEERGDFLIFEKASEIVIYLSSETDFYEKDYKEKCLSRIKWDRKDYEDIKKRHIEDFSSLFNRVKIDLGGTYTNDTSDVLRQAIIDGEKDNASYELMFNMGRYLLISSSRKGSAPANLQGVWNTEFSPEFECNYTININTEMNYWPAEICNLHECHIPLFDFVKRMIPNGKKTAKSVYGCNGFVAHHATNIFADTSITGRWFPSSVWPMGGAWLSLHLWESYRYSADVEFLKNEVYPILKENAIFLSEYMVENEDGYIVTGPTISPEFEFYTEDGSFDGLCMGTEMDNQIAREIFNAVIESAKILRIDDEFTKKIKELVVKIRQPQINRDGGIMEWMKDYVGTEVEHRHLSHLFGIMPGNDINPNDKPILSEACRKSLKLRFRTLGKQCGWTYAWGAAIYARLFDGDSAAKLLNFSFSHHTHKSFLGCYMPGLFQIDSNLGTTCAIAQMLLQSHEGYINVLPAVPKEWNSGEFKGLCARNGFEVDAVWKNGNAKSVTVLSKCGQLCKIKINGTVKADFPFEISNGIISFNTEKGKTYTLQSE